MPRFHCQPLIRQKQKKIICQRQQIIKLVINIINTHPCLTCTTQINFNSQLLITIMICNYCQHSPSKLHNHYNIEQVKQRFNPTYSHAHIFNPNDNSSLPVRCTPTFHSTAFNVEGYRPITNQHIKRNVENKKEGNVVYKNVSLGRKQEELNPTSKQFDLNLKNQWYDPAKQELFNSLQCFTERYSRERKLADLSSNPVFGGVTLEVTPRPSIATARDTVAILKEENHQPQPQQPIKHEVEVANNEQKYEQAKVAEPKKSVEVQVQVQLLPKPKEKVQNASTKQNSHKFCIKNEVTFGKTEKAGKRLNKTETIQCVRPAFTIIKSRRN